MFSIEMLQADYGDSLWIEYGVPAERRVIVVDCGFRDNYEELAKRIAGLEPHQLELLVLTHVDEDHIKGGIPLLADERLQPRKTFDVWFNGWEQLQAVDGLGSEQGEFFSALLINRQFNWNASPPWHGGAIVVSPDGPLPCGRLAGGLEWTLLSPTRDKLSAMRRRWVDELENAKHERIKPGDHEAFLALFRARKDLQASDALGDTDNIEIDIEKLISSVFEEDDAEPNGSSIALLFEYEGKSILLGADAHPSVLQASLMKLAQQRKIDRVHVDAFKVAHHGSRKNTNEELLRAIDCSTFLFSSSGKKFRHPTPECIARIVSQRKQGCRLHFNYESKQTLIWANENLQRNYDFTSVYPKDEVRVLKLL